MSFCMLYLKERLVYMYSNSHNAPVTLTSTQDASHSAAGKQTHLTGTASQTKRMRCTTVLHF